MAEVPVKRPKSIFDEMEKMRDRVMSRAHEIFSGNGGIFGRELDDWLQAERELVWKPAIELTEKDNAFQLEVAAPGMDAKDFDIEVTPEDILIKAEAQHEHKKEKGEIHISEFAYGNLFRSIRLPKKIDPENVTAEFKNGVLTLNAPIAAEARAKKVTVGAA